MSRENSYNLFDALLDCGIVSICRSVQFQSLTREYHVIEPLVQLPISTTSSIRSYSEKTYPSLISFLIHPLDYFVDIRNVSRKSALGKQRIDSLYSGLSFLVTFVDPRCPFSGILVVIYILRGGRRFRVGRQRRICRSE